MIASNDLSNLIVQRQLDAIAKNDDPKAKKRLAEEIKRRIALGQMGFSIDDAGVLRYAETGSGHWITIGGSSDETGKRRGGSPVYIENGRITKGHPSLTGKKVGNLKEAAAPSHHRKQLDVAKAMPQNTNREQRARKAAIGVHNREITREEQHAEAGYQRAVWNKKARKEGIRPEHVHSLAAEMLAHDKAHKQDVVRLLQETRDSAKKLGINVHRSIASFDGGDHAQIKGFDLLARDMAGRYPEILGAHGYGHHEGYDSKAEEASEKLFSLLQAGNPESMTEADAYEQAFDFLLSRKADAVEVSDDPIPFAIDGDGVLRYAGIDDAAANANPNPSAAQKSAGNYRKGHIVLHGLNITIETAAGNKRRPEWDALRHHYGYIKRTKSDADGDHVDVFIGPDPNSELVFVVDQVKPGGRFDEHKCMLGFTNAAEAKQGYLANYNRGWTGFGGMKTLTIEAFKRWLAEGDTGKRAVPQQMTFAISDEGLLYYQWDESQHKRGQPGNKGQFASGGNSSASAVKPSAAPKTRTTKARPFEQITIGEGGVLEPAKKSSGRLAKAVQVLKSAGAKAGHLEHIAAAYAKDKIQSAVEKLPPWAQTSVHGIYAVGAAGTKAAFAAWTVSQELAERVAVERGATPEEARRLRGVLASIDIAAFKPAAIMAAGSAGLTAATWVIPPATGIYLAYSVARNPIKTAHAAVGLVRDALVTATVGAGIVAIGAAEKLDFAESGDLHHGQLVADALQDHDYDDWYIALLSASMDGCADLAAAIAMANRLWEVQGKIDYMIDASGHEHKGKGPGGGQFTGSGGGAGATQGSLFGDGGREASTKAAKSSNKPTHGSRLAALHAKKAEIAKAHAALQAERVETYNAIKADAETSLDKAAENGDKISPIMENVYHGNAGEYGELEELIADYDPDETPGVRFGQLKEIEAKAKECLNLDEPPIDDKGALAEIKKLESKLRPNEEEIFEYMTKKRSLEASGDKAGLAKHLEDRPRVLGIFDEIDAIRKKIGELEQSIPDGLTAEMIAKNKQSFAEIAVNAREARKHLKAYVQHRKEMKAIKTGDVEINEDGTLLYAGEDEFQYV